MASNGRVIGLMSEIHRKYIGMDSKGQRTPEVIQRGSIRPEIPTFN